MIDIYIYVCVERKKEDVDGTEGAEWTLRDHEEGLAR